MAETLDIVYKDLKALENLIDKFAYQKETTQKNMTNIHIEELRNWHLRVEQMKYAMATILNIDEDFGHDYECPLCNGTDDFITH